MTPATRIPIGLIATLAFVAGAAGAQPSVELVGPGDFSGAETQLTFDDLGLANGGDIPVIDGVEFELDVGAPAKFIVDTYPRETGPQGTGSVNNFWSYQSPYPDLGFRFPGVMHRVSFEMRVNAGDEVSVTLRSAGVDVDTMVMPSHGSDMLYFYGLENAQGFDEVWVDVVDYASGAFTFDNLTFESLGVPDEEPGAPVLSCVGFDSPYRRWHHTGFLKATLLDADGVEVGRDGLETPPVARVVFAPAGGGDAQDVTDRVVWGDGSFGFTRRGSWAIFQMPWRMREAGTYMTTMESGDPAEYVLDPTCVEWTERTSRRHRYHRYHRHHD